MASQLAASRSQFISGVPQSFLSCRDSAFAGQFPSSFLPCLLQSKDAASSYQLVVRSDIKKGYKRVVTSKATKGGSSIAEKPEGTQVIERRGGPKPVRPSTPQEQLSHMAADAMGRIAERKKSANQSSPLSWVSELAFENPVAKVIKQAAGSVAVAVGSSLFRETSAGDVDAPEVDYALRGNFAPVTEVGAKLPISVIDGAVPKGFPDGVYVRNGPNPQYPPKSFKSITGNLTKYHWFEGDGMLHAVWFKNGKASYQNKYVGTEGYVRERDAGKAVLLGTLAAQNVLENMAVNALTQGIGFKHTANTHVVGHHGRLLALMEAGPPHEVQMDDLATVGVCDFEGQLDTPFTAHPKTDPKTGDMVFFGYQVTPPYVTVGVISKEGELVHKTPVNTDRPTMMHDFAITENYNVILDFPLTFSFERLLKGRELIEFEKEQPSKFGVMPRFRGKDAVRWIESDTCFAFHTLNAYEDGNEIVVYGCASKNPALSTPADKSPQEYFKETLSGPDGALMARLTEWRIDLKTGSVCEKLLVPLDISADMPRINDHYAGLRNKYGYGLVTDVEATVEAGMPLHTSLVKYYLPETKDAQVPIKLERHQFGSGRYASEASFVAREGSMAEDDGWLVCYVFDEKAQSSELVIIDAQRFAEPPVARLALPQRVPFGLHGSYVPC